MDEQKSNESVSDSKGLENDNLDPTSEQLTTPPESKVPVQADTSQLFAADNPNGTPQEKPKKKFGKKKFMLIFLLLAAAGATAWWFLIKKDPTPTSNNNQSTNQQQNTQTQSDFKTPDNIIYAFREADDAPLTIYSRPVGGGDRKELAKLAKNEFPGNSDVRNNVVAYSTDQAIYVSTDSGTSFKKIYDLKQGVGGQLGEQVTSLKIDASADNLAVGILPIDGTQNSVNQFSLDGSTKNELFKSDKPGVFIDEWSQSLGKMVYSQGCYNCDGNQPTPLIWSQNKNQSSELSSSIKPGTLIDTDLNEINGQLVVVYGAADKNSDGLGVNIIAPYKISRFNINSDDYSETVVKTIGTVGEKNPNGTTKSRTVLGGFIWQTDNVYYTDDNQMFYLTDQKESLALSSDKLITRANFVDANTIIFNAGEKQSVDFVVNNHSVSGKQSTQVLVGDANTFIFGVTTK